MLPQQRQARFCRARKRPLADNIAALDTRQYPQGIRFVLARKGQQVPAGVQVVESPSDKGIILDRRLAPTAELFAQVDQARRADSCAPLSGPA